jgi:hypothetical protein
MIKYRIAAAIALALAGTVGATSAMAAHTTPSEAAAAKTAAADQALAKLSDQGNQAIQEIDVARIAIFNGHPNLAQQLIKRAQLSLTKAEADGTAFNKAEADLKGSPQHPNPAPGADSSSVQWLPIGVDMTLEGDYATDPKKAAAVAAANVHLKKGERDQAIQTLRLADINLSYTMAVLPVKSAVASIDEASTLLANGKYYEANLSLKRVQDSVRYDWMDLNAAPLKSDTSTSSNASSPAASASTAASE